MYSIATEGLFTTAALYIDPEIIVLNVLLSI